MDRSEFIRGCSAFATFLVGRSIFASTSPVADVPAYYDSYLSEIVAKINRNRMERRCDAGFIFFTDPHIKSNYRRSGFLIARLLRETGLTRVLSGGDLVEAFGADYLKDKDAVDFAIEKYRRFWVAPIRAAGGRLYTAKGNHDFTVRHSLKVEDGNKGFTYSGDVARRLIVDEWTEKDAISNVEDLSSCYYYADDHELRLRFIIADTTDSERSGDVAWGVASGVHETQLKWLARTFETIPVGWSAVVMHHIPVTGVVGSNEEVKNFAAFRALLNRYHDRVLLDLTGHHHCEMQTFQNGIWYVTNPCDAAYCDYINRSKPWCPNLPVKNGGTIYEQTFDVVQINTSRSLVRFTRVGGGGDRMLHCRSINLSVCETRKFKTSLHGKIVWGCYDADRVDRKPDPANKWGKVAIYHNDVAAISSDGVLTAQKSGESVVVALAENGDKELFPVRVA